MVQKHLGGETRNGTTHLKNHIVVCQDRATRKGLTQSTLKLSANPQDGTVTLEKYVFDQDVARKELALMIIVHEFPLSMVDYVGFRKFCAALQPAFKVVSRNTIRKDILDMYQVQKQSGELHQKIECSCFCYYGLVDSKPPEKRLHGSYSPFSR